MPDNYEWLRLPVYGINNDKDVDMAVTPGELVLAIFTIDPHAIKAAKPLLSYSYSFRLQSVRFLKKAAVEIQGSNSPNPETPQKHRRLGPEGNPFADI